MKKILKKISKTKYFENVIALLIYAYTWFLKLTCRVNYHYPNNLSKKDFYAISNTAIVIWHKDIINAFITISLGDKNLPNISPLISPHSDARYLAKVMEKIGHKVISGSTNKEGFKSLKALIKTLRNGNNIIITPDGPRGPAKQINSNIGYIIQKENSTLIAIRFKCSKYTRISSWDRLIIPRPFSLIEVYFSAKNNNSCDTKDEIEKNIKTMLNEDIN